MKLLPNTRREKIRLLLLLGLLATPFLLYAIWSPGQDIRDGSHDRQTNGMWMSHRWLGDDRWFSENDREHLRERYRDPKFIESTLADLKSRGVVDLMPHLAPAGPGGSLPAVDAQQTERFLATAEQHGQRVLPWIGGVFERDCHPGLAHWREAFVQSIVDLLSRHPELAGIHLNIEPWPSGDADMLKLLEQIKAALPEGKLLSVAAYPPPTRWQPDTMVHWDEAYFREVARRSDHLAVMMYDTSIPVGKPYVSLMSKWTGEVLAWSEGRQVLLGVPAYADEDVDYHNPAVENLGNALRGIHAVLQRQGLPDHYRGIAIYSLWEMSDAEWDEFESGYQR